MDTEDRSADDKLQAATHQLLLQRRTLARLQSDYQAILGSRFHALRMLWMSLKGVFGLRSEADEYAAWTAQSAPAFAAALHAPKAVPRTASTADGAPPTVDARLQPFVNEWNEQWSYGPRSRDPDVAVIIPVFNQLDATVRCLLSLAATGVEGLIVQVIVVDDGSSDATPAVLPMLDHIEYVRGPNVGFVRACNRGAQLAKAPLLCFLNNDTTVRPGWLEALCDTINANPDVGAAGAKLVYPDGRLQEAGGIIWRDATGNNFGRGQDPNRGIFNFRREVDYCSGAALAVRSDLFRRLGGFSERYAPAYYEDADLCFAIRSLGYRVVYDPQSVVVHYEGITSGTDLSLGTKRYQEINRPKFRERWAAELAGHYDNDPANVLAGALRLHSAGGKTILVVDTHVPMPDRDAGSARLRRVLEMLREAGHRVIFFPDNFAPLQPYTAELQRLGIEVVHRTDSSTAPAAAFDQALPGVDVAWICRPDLFAKYAPRVRKRSAAKILYDTIDLHFVRARREAEVVGDAGTAWEDIEREEMAAAASADATIVVSAGEAAILSERHIAPVFVVPTVHDAAVDGRRDFATTEGVLFIGGYNHPPNVDAAVRLAESVMPLVRERIPDATLTLLGSNPPDRVFALRNEFVDVPGYVADVEPFFLRARVFAAPMRFGAGMKGKVGHALSYGLPVVTTPIGAEGFDLESDVNCLIETQERAFAEAIVRLYGDPGLWQRLSDAGVRSLDRVGSVAVGATLRDLLETICSERQLARPKRDTDVSIIASK